MKRLTVFLIVALVGRATGVFGDATEPSAATADEPMRVRTLTSEQASFAFGEAGGELGSSNHISLLSDAEMEEIEGDGWGLVLRAAARYASRYVAVRRYPNTGGGGISFFRNGRRVFGVDIHGWRGGTRWYHRIHYHRRPGIRWHRPWQRW
ncbi:MAG: hypothetical protein OXJ56_13745 [Rhodospirillaceae bacterium]|nr:hypothetical protein [Rhodospirillaceae bacterium]